MIRQKPVWISAKEFNQRFGFTNRRAQIFRQLNQDKGMFKRKDSGQFLYNAAKIPESLKISE